MRDQSKACGPAAMVSLRGARRLGPLLGLSSLLLSACGGGGASQNLPELVEPESTLEPVAELELGSEAFRVEIVEGEAFDTGQNAQSSAYVVVFDGGWDE